MVMSLGYNPFYKNTVRSAEVHILHDFAADFYDAPMRLLLLGYVRPELDYTGPEALIADIKFDCDVTRASLARPGWAAEAALAPGCPGGGGFDASWLVRPLDS